MIMEHINATPHKQTHRELLPSSIKKDTAAVKKVIACIEVVDNLLNARAKGACIKRLSLALKMCSAIHGKVPI